MSAQPTPDSNDSKVEAKTATPPPKKSRGFMLRLLGIVVLVAAIGWGLWYFLDGRWYESTDDAYVNGNVVSIGADDGALVHAGDVLVKLDPSDADVALAEAKANLALTVRKVRGLYSSVNGAQADVAAR